MNPHAIIDEHASRRISPFLFVAALVCFFFTFAGVSCNTTKAKQALNGVSQFNGASGGANIAEANRCLDALQGVAIFSYTGFALSFGGTPSELSQLPAGCRGAIGTGVAPSANAPEIGVQPLELTAFIIIVIGIVTGALFAVVRMRPQLRCSLAMLLGAVAFLL
ncbi:MAG TPA: hypothetical protein VFA70_15220, partial [Dehalococcoidia bacterium]|nr:hypothetical protein [Dehalococcoidia bacterium]